MNLNNALKKHEFLYTFIFAFIIIFIFLRITNNRLWPFDSSNYTNLANTLGYGSNFALSNFPLSIRGICYPLLLNVFFGFFNILHLSQYIGFMVLSSGVTALVCACLPMLVSPYIKKDYPFLWNLFPVLLIIIFWNGIIIYPLSDLYAFAAMIFAVCFSRWIINKPNGEISAFRIFLIAILVGLLLYFSYNTRTIYLFPVIIFIPASIFLNYKKGTLTNIIFVAGMLIGIAALGSLQGVVNLIHFNQFSLDINTVYYFGGDGISSVNVTDGISASQYETFTGPTAQFPAGAIKFSDFAGQAILTKEGLTGVLTLKTYFALVFKYPFDFLGIYAHHFINALNPVLGGGYVSDIYKPKLILSIFNYILLFILGIQIHINIRDRVKGLKTKFKEKFMNIDIPKATSVVFLVLLFLPCLLILPSMVESRYYFPMYILIYCILSFIVDYKKVWATIKAHPISNILLFIIIYASLCTVWGTTYASVSGSIT